MWRETPSTFYRLLGWADAEAEAKPIQNANAVREQKAAARTKENAQGQVRTKRLGG